MTPLGNKIPAIVEYDTKIHASNMCAHETLSGHVIKNWKYVNMRGENQNMARAWMKTRQAIKYEAKNNADVP